TEMDLKVLRHLPESRFASVIGIAKETLGFAAADENSTYNNVEQADARSIKSYVKPLWGYIEDELTHQLGPDFGLADNQRFAFDLSEIAVLQEDQNALHQRAALDLGTGGNTGKEYSAHDYVAAGIGGGCFFAAGEISGRNAGDGHGVN